METSDVREEVSSKDYPLGLGIIGFGNIGRQHYNAACADALWEVKAVADPHLIAEELPHSLQAFEHWEGLLTDPEIGAVSICVPHHLHYSITMAALEAGKHVLVEKPLGLDMAESRVLIECADSYRRTLMVELTHRFYPPMQEAKAFVQSGRLGEIYAVEDRIVETACSQIKPWLKTKSQAGGGVALTNGVHMVDRIAALTGQELTFVAGRAGYSAKLGDVEDTAAMLLSLQNGAPVQVLASWPLGKYRSDDELTVYGTRGTLRIWSWRGWRFEPADGSAMEEHHCYAAEDDLEARVQKGVAGAMQEFALAILEQREPNPPASAALKAQVLIEEFYQHIGKDPGKGELTKNAG
jgi:predicted dehydrogenase